MTVAMNFADNANGISKKVFDKIFQPFLLTR